MSITDSTQARKTTELITELRNLERLLMRGEKGLDPEQAHEALLVLRRAMKVLGVGP